MIVNSLNHFKSVFAGKFFVQPADRNYVLARWARIVGLTRESFIQAHQAIEKYFKAALVLNGCNVSPFGHDIESLYQKHCETFGDLAIREVEKPAALNQGLWLMPQALHFIQHIESNGNPNSRYALTSFAAFPSDLFHLDEIVRRLRRLAVGLDWIVGEDWPLDEKNAQYAGATYRECLMNDPWFQVRGQLRWFDYRDHGIGITLADALKMGNVAHFSDLESDLLRVPLTAAAQFGPIENSYLFLLAQALQNAGTQSEVRLGAHWITDNVYLPHAVRQEIRALAGDV